MGFPRNTPKPTTTTSPGGVKASFNLSTKVAQEVKAYADKNHLTVSEAFAEVFGLAILLEKKREQGFTILAEKDGNFTEIQMPERSCQKACPHHP